MRRATIATCGVVGVLLLLGATPFAAADPTVLTGQTGPEFGTFTWPPPPYTSTYGSKVLNTPYIDLLWASSGNVWGIYGNWDGRGAVYSMESAGGYDMRTITFTPASGYDVSIESFVLDEWAGGGNPFSAHWSVSGAVSGTIASGDWILTSGSGRSTVTVDAAGAWNEAVTLAIQQTRGTHDYLAMDDLAFSQISSALLGDANGDGVVDAADYIILKQHFGQPAALGSEEGDFDTDDDVDWDDLQILVGAFNGGSESPAVPEPATIGLLAVGGLAALRRRRHRA